MNTKCPPLIFAVAGSGPVAEFHIKTLQKEKKTRVIGICSGNKPRVDALSKKYDLIQYPSLADMFKDSRIQVVDICNSNNNHYLFARKSLENNRHVLIEKPVAFSSQHVFELSETAFKKKLSAGVIFQKRYNRTLKVAKSLIHDEIGEVRVTQSYVFLPRSADYFARPEKSVKAIAGGGALIYQGIHDLDLLVNLFGCVADISGACQNIYYDMEVEDSCILMLKFQNGVISNFHVSTAPNYPFLSVHIIIGKEKFLMMSNEYVHIFPIAYLLKWQNFIKNITFFDRIWMKLPNFFGGKCLARLRTAICNRSINKTACKYFGPFQPATYHHVLKDFLEGIFNPVNQTRASLHTAVETHRIVEKVYELAL